MIHKDNETICAISTPHGIGGIAVVRVSGPDATAIVQKRWSGKHLNEMASHTAHLGKIADSDGHLLDEAVLTLFRGPQSFTGEDVVELSCHGSPWIQQQVINTLVDAGCRVAQAGEFTRRAFSNGKLDLSQAEAVADVIASQSRASHRVAMSQMRGAFSRKLSNLREQLLTFVSLIELELDFSEEDVSFASTQKLLALALEIHESLSALAGSFSTGIAIKNGIPVAIVGATNAGKSTLLNALLHDDRAIVSDVHGTTRDVIEDTTMIDGTLFRFIDTAGIRHATDAIEAIGIERTFERLSKSQIVLWVVDATADATQMTQFGADLVARCEGKQLIAVINKTDLCVNPALERVVSKLLPQGATIVKISAHSESDLQRLQQEISRVAAMPQVADGDVIVTNARHYEALRNADAAIERVIDGIEAGVSEDFLSQDLRECMHYLGEITGEITTHEILGSIFSRFCVGK